MPDALTPDHVQAVLDAHMPGTSIRFFETTTATSQQAADNIPCLLGQIVKSLCFMVETGDGLRPVLVLASGDQRVDDRKLAEHYEVGRKKVRVATPDECVILWGYVPGGVPPFGHRTSGLHTFIDQSLTRFDQLYAAGGAHNAIFPITLTQLQTITGGQMMAVVRDTPPAEG